MSGPDTSVSMTTSRRQGTAFLIERVVRVDRTRRRVTRKLVVAVVLMTAVLGVGAGSAVAGSRANVPGGAAAAKKPTSVVTVEVSDTAGLAGPMTMTVSPTSVPAGKVKFVATNNGTIIHEVIVLKTKAAVDALPVNPKTNRVSEAKSVGEISEFGKGKTKSVTLKLKKGSYLLVCNVAKHYGLGMRAAFTVT
jgi:uncharacterized cupredoxin-like copper-binding protein